MSLDRARIDRLLAGVGDRTVLLEPEGLDLLEAMGISVPAHRSLTREEQVTSGMLDGFAGERVVVKVVSPTILHKSDVGGVIVLPRDPERVAEAVGALRRRFEGSDLHGFLLEEFVPYDHELGGELILGMRWTEDFGPVVTFGAGGIHTEFLAANFRPGRELAILPADMDDPRAIGAALDPVAVTALLTGGLRGQKPWLERAELERVIAAFMEVARLFLHHRIAEFEVNPMVVSGGRCVALDALVKLRRDPEPGPAPRPLAKIKNLLEPGSVAVIGVSEKLNPGHIIVNNLIREGYDRKAIAIVKPGSTEIEGCRCFASIGELPAPVDLFILSISAAQVPDAVAEIVEQRKAESLIVIPGGLEEKEGTAALVARMKASIAAARKTAWGGPVINGGNSLGIRSLPGRYDTMFIPQAKLPLAGPMDPIALISNSGAFAVTRAGKLPGLNPRFVISVGNQMDLTVGDFMTYLKDEPGLRVFAVYVEGFRRLDGLQFLKASREIVAGGRTVILYRAGRTQEGAKATASHTASLAGDYAVTRALARQAGVVVAETLEDFDDLCRLFARLDGMRVRGFRLGAVSNAGFECVTVADNLGPFELAPFTTTTRERLEAVFEKVRIQDIVDVHNPIDLTPMAPDEAYEETARAILEDPGVDVGLVGCVPLTAALHTLPPGPGHHDDLYAPGSVASRLIRLKREIGKPWVVVIDGGAVFDPLARYLEENGVPTFRNSDRALRMFGEFCRARLERGAGAADTPGHPAASGN